jgi:hypothetical protein
MINKLICYTQQVGVGGSPTTLNVFHLIASEDFIAAGVAIGDIVVNETTFKSATVLQILSSNDLLISDDIFLNLSDNYMIYSGSIFSEADRVSNGKITMLNASSLTAPNVYYPSYVILGDTMSIYPSALQGYGRVRADYFRYPKTPKWTYSTLFNGTPVFDQSQPDYQDFEMPAEDEFKLVMKILQYSGVSIREMDLSQFGMLQEQHEQPTFSQQQ